MTPLKLVALDDVVVFPGMPVTLPVDVGADTRVFLVPRRGNGYAKVGVVAEVTERVALGGRSIASFMPLHRAVPGAAQTGPDGVLRVEVDERPDPDPAKGLTRELEREYRAVVEEILEIRGDDGRISAFVRSITHPGALADTAGYSPDFNLEQKLELLEALDVVERLTLALRSAQSRGTVDRSCQPEAVADFLVAALEGAILLTKLTKDIAVMERCVAETKRYLSLFEPRV